MTYQGFDATRPNVARVFDVLLSGRDNFAANREETGPLVRICPQFTRPSPRQPSMGSAGSRWSAVHWAQDHGRRIAGRGRPY